MQFLKSGSGTIGSNTIVADGESLGMIEWYADDGTDYASRSAYIIGEIDGATGTNDVPGRLIFGTTADGANNPTEALRIDSSQDVRAKGGDLYLDLNAGVVNDYMRSIYFTVDSSPTTTQAIRAKEHSTDSYGLEFHTYGGGSLQEALRIDGSQMLKIAAGSGTTIPTDGQYWWADINGDMHLSSQGALLVDIDTNANNSNKTFAVRANAGTTSLFQVNEAGLAAIGDTANANMTVGLTINQGANDDEILALKSSDVAHGMTTRTETDTFGLFAKSSATVGGLKIEGWAESSGTGLELNGANVTDNTAKDGTALAPIMMQASKKSGTSTAAVGADGNLFVIRTGGSTKFIVDEDGELFADGGTSTTNMVTLYDNEQDIELSRSFYHALSDNGAKGLVRDRWDDWVNTSEQDLVDIGILGAPLSEGGLVNYSGLARLNTGAIWQLNTKHMSLAEEVNSLKAELALANQKLKALEA
jgi:hypothetical protein